MIYGIPVGHKLKRQFDVLNEKVRLFSRTKTEDHVHALNEIAEKGSPYDASYIFNLIFSEKEIIANTAAYTTVKLLRSGQEKNVWLNLYDSFRYAHNFQKGDLQFLERFLPDDAIHLFGIASLNYSGYIREEAMYYLNDIPSSEKLPYILLRLNDWVSPVREKAQGIFENILPEIPVCELIHHHQLIEWLERTTRVDLEHTVSAINERICSPKNREQLLSGMNDATFKERLFCWRVLRSEVQKTPTLIERAIQDPAPEIRQWAARNLPHDKQMKARISQLLSDKSIRVKYEALKTIPRDKWQDYQQIFEHAIYDDSRSIREYSRFALRNLSDIDNFSELYRNQLKKATKPKLGSIAGLAETGEQEDTDLLRTFLKDERSKVRAATFLALHKLNAEDMEDLYIRGLIDTGRVSKSCATILSDKLPSNLDKVYRVFKEEKASARKSALKVLTAQGKLEALLYIFEAILDENGDIQKLAHQYLKQWYWHYSVRAWLINAHKKELYNEIQSHWQKVKLSLGEDFHDGLDHLLSSLNK